MQTTVYSLYFSLPLQGMILQNRWTFKPCEGQLLPLLLPCSAQRAGWGCTGTSRQRPVHAAPAQALLGNSQRPGSPPFSLHTVQEGSQVQLQLCFQPESSEGCCHLDWHSQPPSDRISLLRQLRKGRAVSQRSLSQAVMR